MRVPFVYAELRREPDFSPELLQAMNQNLNGYGLYLEPAKNKEKGQTTRKSALRALSHTKP